jgi:ABC-type glycerol-3-phosphate transport system permease component
VEPGRILHAARAPGTCAIVRCARLRYAHVTRPPDWQFLTAAAFISMIVPIIVFLSPQRSFVRGITGGAVKG